MHPRRTRSVLGGSLFALLAGAMTVGCGGVAASERVAPPTMPSVASTGDEAPAPSAPMAQPASEMAVPAGAIAMRPPSVEERAAHVAPPVTSGASGSTTANNGETNVSSTAPDAAPMLIYVADVSMVVERVTETADHAVQLVTQSGGFLVSRDDSSLQVRVPSAHFREALAALEHLGDVTHRQIAAEDVSEQYHDLDVQLANLSAVRARLEDFLRRAGSMQDALSIEHELERVGAQIDQIEGRMRFLAARAAFSTITLRFTRREVVTVIPTSTPDQNGSLPFTWLSDLGLPRLVQFR